jgi:hypothetical protein
MCSNIGAGIVSTSSSTSSSDPGAAHSTTRTPRARSAGTSVATTFSIPP